MRWTPAPFAIVAAVWVAVLTAVVAYSVQEFWIPPIEPIKAEVLSAQVDHIIYSTTFRRIKDCKTEIDRFILENPYSAVGGADRSTVVNKTDVTYHRSSVPGWSRPNLPVPQNRSSIVRIGGLNLPEGRALQFSVIVNSFCPIANRQDRYDPIIFMVPSGSDDGLMINRFDDGP